MRVEAVILDLSKAPTQVLETKSKGRLRKIWGFNPSVVTVLATGDPRKIKIVGVKPGVSPLMLSEEDGTEEKLTIVIPEMEVIMPEKVGAEQKK